VADRGQEHHGRRMQVGLGRVGGRAVERGEAGQIECGRDVLPSAAEPGQKRERLAGSRAADPSRRRA
jgi:hypothetical protein